MKVRDCKIVLCILMLLATGCTKRYWYRTKIDVPQSNKYSVEIHIVNESPQCLNRQFCNAMHKAAAKSFKTFGYYETRVKSPRFIYTLVLSIDSFHNPERHWDSRYGVGLIKFKSKLDDTKYGNKWFRFDQIYFFGVKRDIVRSKGVVRRLIRIGEQKRYEY